MPERNWPDDILEPDVLATEAGDPHRDQAATRIGVCRLALPISTNATLLDKPRTASGRFRAPIPVT